MKKIIFVLVAQFTAIAFANPKLEFTKLDCVVSPKNPKPFEEAFRMTLEFPQPVSSVNDSGLDKAIQGNMTVTYAKTESSVNKVTIENVAMSQATGAYGYEIKLSRKIMGSNYPTSISIHPQFQRSFFNSPTLYQYIGSLQLNAAVEGQDVVLINSDTSGPIMCAPTMSKE